MAYPQFEIKNSALDGGNWVTLPGVTLTLGLKKEIRTNPLHGQVDTTTEQFQIAKADRAAVSNPIFNLTFSIDVSNYVGTATSATTILNNFWRTTPSSATVVDLGGVSMASEVTMGYIYRLLLNATGQTYLRIKFGHPTYPIYWVKTDFSYPPTSSDFEIPVEVLSGDIAFDQQSDSLHIINVSIPFVEVRV